MSFGFIIFLRISFAACMVFVIGYVFGSFAKNATLNVLSKIAAILAIVIFITTNVALMRFGHHGWFRYGAREHCEYYQKDSVGR